MRNWTIKEAVEVINANQDQEAIKEIAKHFPQAFMAICKNDMAALTQAMNEKFTLRRLQFATVEADADAEEDGEDETPAVPKAVDKKAPAKAVETDDTDLSTMTAKQLMKLCDDKGIKVPHYGKNKQFYLDALQGGAEEPAEAEVEQEDTEEAADAYEGKTAMELYKLCKKRGVKVEPKKSTKVYIAALKKADEAEAATEEDTEDDGWGEEEEEAPKKAIAKKTGKATAKKSEPADEEDAGDDEDDEWDI